MALLNRFNRFLAAPGQGQALGMLGSHLMAAGAPSTDPGNASKMLALGMQQYQQQLQLAQERQRQAQMDALKKRAIEMELAQGEAAAQQATRQRQAALGMLPQLMEKFGWSEPFARGVVETGGVSKALESMMREPKTAKDVQGALRYTTGPQARQRVFPDVQIPKKAPTTRTVRRGDKEVTEEWDTVKGEWTEAGRGPAWKPDQDKPSSSIASVYTADGKYVGAFPTNDPRLSRYQGNPAYHIIKRSTAAETLEGAGIPGLSKSDVSKAAKQSIEDAYNLSSAGDLLGRLHKYGAGITGVRAKLGEVGGAVSATGIPFLDEAGQVITKQVTGVSQRELSAWVRDARAFIAQSITEISGEGSSRFSEPERKITEDAERTLKGLASFEEVKGALEAATAARFTARLKTRFTLGQEGYDLESDAGIRQFFTDLRQVAPQMSSDVMYRALGRMQGFYRFAASGK